MSIEGHSSAPGANVIVEHYCEHRFADGTGCKEWEAGAIAHPRPCLRAGGVGNSSRTRHLNRNRRSGGNWRRPRVGKSSNEGWLIDVPPSAVGRNGDRLPRLDLLLQANDPLRHMLEGVAAEQKLRWRIVGFDEL